MIIVISSVNPLFIIIKKGFNSFSGCSWTYVGLHGYLMNKFVLWHICGSYLVFLSWSLIFFSISASVRVSNRGHHWSASPVLRMAISTVGNGFSLRGNIDTNHSFHKCSSTDSCIWAWFSHIWFYVFMLFLSNSSNFWCFCDLWF